MYENREEAGKELATALAKYKENKDTLVIGLPRGGVVTAYEVASALHLPLDVICPRKVGAPNNPELAIGAVTETGEGFFNEDVISYLNVSQEYMQQACLEEQKRAQMRTNTFRKGRPPLSLENKIVIIVDDGLATGATMKAAILSLKGKKTAKIIVAIPVSPPETAKEVKALCDELVVLQSPWFFQAVGQFYADFGQTTDEEVVELLAKSHAKNSGTS